MATTTASPEKVGFPGERNPGRYAGEVEAFLKHHKITMFGAPRTGGIPLYRKRTHAEAAKEADNLGYTGWLKVLYVKEQMTGWAPASSTVETVDEVLGPLLKGLGFKKGELGGIKLPVNPKTHTVKEEAGETTVEEGATEVKKAAEGVLGWAEALAKVLKKLLEPSFWLRVLKYVLGGVLLIVALILFARASGVGATVPVSGATQRIARGSGARRRRVSTGARQRVAEGRRREAQREPERSHGGRELHGTALQARERRRTRERREKIG